MNKINILSLFIFVTCSIHGAQEEARTEPKEPQMQSFEDRMKKEQQAAQFAVAVNKLKHHKQRKKLFRSKKYKTQLDAFLKEWHLLRYSTVDNDPTSLTNLTTVEDIASKFFNAPQEKRTCGLAVLQKFTGKKL